MTEANNDADKEAIRAWFKPLLDNVVVELQARNVVSGTAVEASPVWMFPYKILIAKVWGLGQKNRFTWTIAGEAMITDHIPGKMAATPKDAARHFALKWQMDADRLIALANSNTPVEGKREHLSAYAHKLIHDAEALYGLTEQDGIWN